MTIWRLDMRQYKFEVKLLQLLQSSYSHINRLSEFLTFSRMLHMCRQMQHNQRRGTDLIRQATTNLLKVTNFQSLQLVSWVNCSLNSHLLIHYIGNACLASCMIFYPESLKFWNCKASWVAEWRRKHFLHIKWISPPKKVLHELQQIYIVWPLRGPFSS